MMAEEKMGFFKRLVAGLNKTRDNIVSGMDSIFHGFSKIDEDFYEELEEVLIMGDLGVKATYAILDDLRKKVKEQHIKEPIECRQLLIDSIKEQMDVGETAYEFENQTSVVLVIGVNGVGKTTTIGKLAGKMRGQGKKVVLAAADTFRAAAGDQLKEWAHRSDADLIGGQEGADPAAIVYDAVAAAKARKADILLVDTAGRLHNKKNLMEELKKINRVLEREYPEAYRETLVVLDATTGQNALSQAKEFSDVADITGIILTKMDGTAKGGIAVAIQAELGIPVKYIGVGETIDDLQKFDSDEFVQALFNNAPDLKAAISKYIEENAGLKKQMEEFMKEKEAAVKNKLIEGAKEINGVKVIKAVLPMPADAVKNIAFQLKGQFTENLFVVIGSVFENKPLLTVTMSEDQVKAGLNAGQLVREAAKLIQGAGGGQPHFATAGGKNPDGLNAAVDKVVELAGF